MNESLTVRALTARPVVLKLKRPVVARIATITEWPLILIRMTETAHWLEWRDWADPILQAPYAFRGGQLHVPDVPGVGLDWNEDAVKANLPG